MLSGAKTNFPNYESEGRTFESFRARQKFKSLVVYPGSRTKPKIGGVPLGSQITKICFDVSRRFGAFSNTIFGNEVAHLEVLLGLSMTLAIRRP